MVPNIVVTSDTNIQSGSLVVNNLPVDASISYTNVSGLSVSYNSSKGLYTITGSGTASQYQTLFRSFQLTTGNTTASNVTLSFTINTGSGNASYFADTGHYYEYVSFYGTWAQAKANAATKSYNERQGYLATITTADENNFIAQKVSTNGWIGATDEAQEGYWRWATGPEAGTLFWIGNYNGSSYNGAYENWNPSEPNDSGNEDYAEFIASSKGWNDLRSTHYRYGYIIEYGGLNTDNVLGDYAETVQLNITNQRTLTFLDYNDAVLQSQAYSPGTDLSGLSIPNVNGKDYYTFDDWDIEIPSVMPDSNVVLKATYIPTTYQITYQLDGGTNNVNNITTYNYESNTITLLEPTKTGYSFSGWTYNSQSITQIATGSFGDITLTATWTINSYTITFDSDGGSDISAITQDYQSVVNITEIPMKAGHRFIGWMYLEEYVTSITIPSYDIVLIAIYELIPSSIFNITFDSNGGNDISSLALQYGDTIPDLQTPIKIGYTFLGWFDYHTDTKFNELTMIARHVNLYAKWQINQYQVTYHFNNGSRSFNEMLVFNQMIELPENPSRIGYDFLYWSLDYQTPEPIGITTMPANNINIYAIYEVHINELFILTIQGVKITDIESDKDISVNLNLSLPKGYQFVGWFTEPFGRGEMIDVNNPIEDAHDINLYPYIIFNDDQQISSYHQETVSNSMQNTTTNIVLFSMFLTSVIGILIKKGYEQKDHKEKHQ
jgi:uncharacterized repeat protein (TIGR02543 family)